VIEHYAVSPERSWDALVLPDPKRAGRMPEMLKALSIPRREIGNEVLVVGCVTGPFTLTTQLLGMETALNMAIDDTPRLEQIMDFSTEVIICFGLAQIRCGAHMPIVFNPSASPAVVPPQFFREFELPRLIVVLTTSSEDADRIESYRFGVNSYVMKPVDFDQFARAVQQLGLYWLLLNETPQ
jgi:uroporphyrinogen decarboxylase